MAALAFDAPGDAAPRPHQNCYWLVPGLLLAGEHPGTPDPRQLAPRLQAMLDCGLREWLNLTQAYESLPDYAELLRAQASSRTLNVIGSRHPVHDYSVPRAPEMRRILDTIDAAIKMQRPLYLHCHGGIGRTGTVVGCWLVERGLSGDQALALIQRKWQVMAKRDRVPVSPETEGQRIFILEWVAGAGRTEMSG